MRSLALGLLFSAFALTAAMADESCKAQASDKKLAGAALSSFMKKCETDATTACDTQAADRSFQVQPKTASPRSASRTRRAPSVTAGATKAPDAATPSIGPSRLRCRCWFMRGGTGATPSQTPRQGEARPCSSQSGFFIVIEEFGPVALPG